MPLANDFKSLIDTRGLRLDGRVSGLALQRHTAYQRRFYVTGLKEAAQTLGFLSARALWQSLNGEDARETVFAAGRTSDCPTMPVVLAAVPRQWRSDLPDINDKGEAAAHTTYWRTYSESQLLNSWEARAQSLPKALLALTALVLAAERQEVEWNGLFRRIPVAIRPSLFWLIDYNEAVHDRLIGASLPAARAAYAACGLEFDLGPKQRSDALGQAARGNATLTFDAAERLQHWLVVQDALVGPVRVAPQAYKLGVAAEVFAVA